MSNNERLQKACSFGAWVVVPYVVANALNHLWNGLGLIAIFIAAAWWGWHVAGDDVKGDEPKRDDTF